LGGVRKQKEREKIVGKKKKKGRQVGGQGKTRDLRKVMKTSEGTWGGQKGARAGGNQLIAGVQPGKANERTK